MELTRKSVLQLVILAYIAQISNCQHWSYGWLPGGKRSVGELEATLKMMDTGDLVSLSEGPSPLVLESPYEFLSKDSSDFTRNRKRFLQKRRI